MKEEKKAELSRLLSVISPTICQTDAIYCALNTVLLSDRPSLKIVLKANPLYTIDYLDLRIKDVRSDFECLQGFIGNLKGKKVTELSEKESETIIHFFSAVANLMFLYALKDKLGGRVPRRTCLRFIQSVKKSIRSLDGLELFYEDSFVRFFKEIVNLYGAIRSEENAIFYDAVQSQCLETLLESLINGYWSQSLCLDNYLEASKGEMLDDMHNMLQEMHACMLELDDIASLLVSELFSIPAKLLKALNMHNKHHALKEISKLSTGAVTQSAVAA